MYRIGGPAARAAAPMDGDVGTGRQGEAARRQFSAISKQESFVGLMVVAAVVSARGLLSLFGITPPSPVSSSAGQNSGAFGRAPVPDYSGKSAASASASQTTVPSVSATTSKLPAMDSGKPAASASASQTTVPAVSATTSKVPANGTAASAKSTAGGAQGSPASALQKYAAGVKGHTTGVIHGAHDGAHVPSAGGMQTENPGTAATLGVKKMESATASATKAAKSSGDTTAASNTSPAKAKASSNTNGGSPLRHLLQAALACRS
jgi:hypothetical protein